MPVNIDVGENRLSGYAYYDQMERAILDRMARSFANKGAHSQSWPKHRAKRKR